MLGLAFAPDHGPSTVYGLTDVPELITFDATAPEALTATVPISGVAAGSTLLALDVDPADGRVLALSDAGRAVRHRPGDGGGDGDRRPGSARRCPTPGSASTSTRQRA